MDAAYNLPLLNGEDIPVRQRADGVWLICHVLTRAWLVLQPEEWVRQHLINFLLSHGYPAALMRTERKVPQANRRTRYDVLCYDNAGQPLLLAECKGPNTPINKAALQQAGRYNATVGARYILITNGVEVAVYKTTPYGYLQLQAIPTYREAITTFPDSL